MVIAVLSSLILAGAALPAADQSAIEARVHEIFHPYSQAEGSPISAELPVFSAETASLIAKWNRVRPKQEVDDLSESDWFCMCQDFDRTKFRAVVRSQTLISPTIVQVTVRVDVGFDQPRDERLNFKKEASGWRLDDMFADEAFPHGLKQALRDTIIADRQFSH